MTKKISKKSVKNMRKPDFTIKSCDYWLTDDNYLLYKQHEWEEDEDFSMLRITPVLKYKTEYKHKERDDDFKEIKDDDADYDQDEFRDIYEAWMSKIKEIEKILLF